MRHRRAPQVLLAHAQLAEDHVGIVDEPPQELRVALQQVVQCSPVGEAVDPAGRPGLLSTPVTGFRAASCPDATAATGSTGSTGSGSAGVGAGSAGDAGVGTAAGAPAAMPPTDCNAASTSRSPCPYTEFGTGSWPASRSGAAAPVSAAITSWAVRPGFALRRSAAAPATCAAALLRSVQPGLTARD